MTDQTDRIKQMAQEAGASFDPTFESVGDNPAFIMSPAELAKFAALVAEDCARVADANSYGPMPHHIGDQLRAMFQDDNTETPLCIVPGVSLKAKAELLERGVKTLEQAKRMTDAELLKVPSIGRRSLSAIRARYPLPK